jgi:hypothetical protein
MPDNEVDLKGLTRALLLGASLGTLPVTIVGCVPATETGVSTDKIVSPYAPQVPSTQSESALCAAALQSRSARAVDTLLLAYPSAGCIPSVLSAMPPSVLVQISPTALAAMSPSVKRQIPPSVVAQLRFPVVQAAPPPPRAPVAGREVRSGY